MINIRTQYPKKKNKTPIDIHLCICIYWKRGVTQTLRSFTRVKWIMVPNIFVSHFSSRIKNRESSGRRMLAIPKRSTYFKSVKRELTINNERETEKEILSLSNGIYNPKARCYTLKIMEDLQRTVIGNDFTSRRSFSICA